MAKTIYAVLPNDLEPLLKEIKMKRIEKMENKSTRSILIDSVKAYHKKVCK